MISITFQEEQKIFHLATETMSYIFKIEEGNIVAHHYFGRRIVHYHGSRNYPRVDRSFSPNFYDAKDRFFSKDIVLQEYSDFGTGDFRTPALVLEQENGSKMTDFRFASYQIIDGKNVVLGLPQIHSENSQTLELLFVDSTLPKIQLYLYFSIVEGKDVVIRSAKLVNQSSESVTIKKMDSCQLDLPESSFELISLPGTWARERQLVREEIHSGIHTIGSTRGASSHQQNPFAALVRPETTELSGEVFGFSFIYSGSFQFTFEKDPFDQLRINMGFNSLNFNWILGSKQEFQTPESVLAYSDQGLNGLSQIYHQLYRENLMRGAYQKCERPILVNNWEATYFDFDEAKIKTLIEESSALGIELFVLDDGWFGKRNSDKTSLGDWEINLEKLPNGLNGMNETAKECQMKFGLWFEPEMISEESELYKEHPDWVLRVPNRPMSRSRDQFVLDFSRADVRIYIYQKMAEILSTHSISYVKWDFNRHLSEVYSDALPAKQQGEVHHRYLLGLYEFLEKLTTSFPNVLFESCSGGGGRFDPGMLYYMPQTWTSDNTDAVARLKIQYSTSLVYPVITMGSHVSAIPNHQTGRETSLEMRGAVAMSGVFGYELDVNSLTKEEKKEIKEQVAFYKEHRQLIQFGLFYRLLSPFEGNQTAWCFVSKDQKECLVFYFNVLEEASAPLTLLKLAGLQDNELYHSDELGTFSGSELMHAGFYTSTKKIGDFRSECYYFKTE